MVRRTAELLTRPSETERPASAGGRSTHSGLWVRLCPTVVRGLCNLRSEATPRGSMPSPRMSTETPSGDSPPPALHCGSGLGCTFGKPRSLSVSVSTSLMPSVARGRILPPQDYLLYLFHRNTEKNCIHWIVLS